MCLLIGNGTLQTTCANNSLVLFSTVSGSNSHDIREEIKDQFCHLLKIRSPDTACVEQ